jgi:hypothetical protein
MNTDSIWFKAGNCLGVLQSGHSYSGVSIYTRRAKFLMGCAYENRSDIYRSVIYLQG